MFVWMQLCTYVLIYLHILSAATTVSATVVSRAAGTISASFVAVDRFVSTIHIYRIR